MADGVTKYYATGHRKNATAKVWLFPGGTGKPVPGPEVTGVNHLSLAVHDIDATEVSLKAVGISLSRPRKEGRGVDGNRGMWIEDPDGNRIEIMEMAPDCIQWEAIAKLRAGGGKTALVAPSRPKAAATA